MGRTLSEHDSKQMIAAHHVPVTPDVIVHDPSAASRAAAELGCSVAVKLTASGLAHKTERGLVRLNIGDPAAVEQAARELLAAAGPEDGDVAVLVTPMVSGTRELIAGVHRDPDFGPCVMVGVGGVLAESIADVVFRLAPIDAADAQEMLDELRSQALLGAVRGEPAVDRGAVAGVLVGLSELVTADADVVAVDVNPLMIVDGRPVAVDALVELATS